MSKYLIKKIKKVDDEKVAVIFTEQGTEQAKKSVRKFYFNKKVGKHVVMFKNAFYYFTLNEMGIASEIETNAAEVKSETAVLTPATKVEKVKVEKINENAGVKHHKFDTIKGLVEANVPVYLYGPAGSGKNHVLQQVAEELGLDFYFTNSVQQEFKITGFIDAGGKFHETEFFRAWTNGGLFFLDEMDASIPEVLTLLNAALANGYFDFPGHGRLDAHKQFRVVAAGNTVGTGADEQYTGRMQLDQATLDRFWFEEFNYDQNIELHIAKGNWELVNFIRDLRKQANDKGINCTFSYRCIGMVTKMEGKLDLKVILTGAVVKGLDKDTLKTFHTTPSNKYSKALWTLQQNK